MRSYIALVKETVVSECRRASQSRYAADGVGGLAFEGRVGEGACVQAALVELAGILRHIG